MNRRIVLMATGLGRGGAETQLVRLTLGLAARGWQPVIGSVVPIVSFQEELATIGVSPFCLNIPKGSPDPRGLARFLAIVARHRPSVICTFLEAANTLGVVAGAALRVPVVVSSIRSSPVHTRSAELQTKLARPLRDAVTFNSQLVADECVSRRLVHPSEVRVIRNGLDFAPFDEARPRRTPLRAELLAGDDPDAFVWLAVGNLRDQKNYPTLVRAFARLHERYPNTRLVCAGKPYDKAPGLVALAPALFERRVIQLLGPRDDVPALLAAADAFVLASLYEGSPNVLLEAMVARVPAVATSVSGVPELVPSSEHALLAAEPSEDAILAAMDRMMRCTSDERARMAATSRAFVEPRFGLERMVDAYEALFLERLSARGVGASA